MLECELQWMWIRYPVSRVLSFSPLLANDTVSLMLVIQHDIAPLGNKKEYTRSLSKDEARAIYSVKRRWPTLCPQSAEIQVRYDSYDMTFR
jgi:hypothetical protein